MTIKPDTYARLSNACMLFGIARDAYERTRGETSDRVSGRGDAVVAVVFSAAALEAFINEVGGIAEGLIQRFVTHDPDSVKQYAALWKEVERLQKSISFEYLLASTAFSGQPYDKGTGPYQDFELLIKLRNALVSFEPDHVELTPGPPKIIKTLRSKNILAEPQPGENGNSWITLIMTRAVARWACNTSANLVRSVLEFVPESVLKKVLLKETVIFFQPLD